MDQSQELSSLGCLCWEQSSRRSCTPKGWTSLCSRLSTLAAEAAPGCSAPKSVQVSSAALESGPIDLSACCCQAMDHEAPNCWDPSTLPDLRDRVYYFRFSARYTAIALRRAETAFSSQSHALVCFVFFQGLVCAALGSCEVMLEDTP